MRLRNRLHIILRHVSFFCFFPQRHYQKQNRGKREEKERGKKDNSQKIKRKNAIHKKILLHNSFH